MWLVFKLTYYKDTVQHFSHYAPVWVVYQRKTRTQIYKHIISFFSFSFITRNGRTGKVRESKMAALHTYNGQGTNLQWTPIFFSLVRSKCSWLYNILDTLINSHGYIFFNLPPMQHTWSHFLLACHPHNLCSIPARNTCVKFTLGTRCISCYFLSQYLTYTVALACQQNLQVNIQHI